MERRWFFLHRGALLLATGAVLMATVATARAQAPAVSPPSGAVAADVLVPGPPAPNWTAEVTVGRERYVSDNAVWRPWSSAELLVARRFTGGSIGAGVAEVERFDRRDGAFSVDLYRALWSGAHGNVRGQIAREGIVLPRSDVSAELYQGFTGGWEPSVGVRRLGYADPVVLASIALGKYVGDRWYGRIRGARAERSGGGSGSSGSALVRRYLGSPREFVELAAGAGKEAVTAGLSATEEVVIDIRQTGFVEVGGRKFVTPRVGGTVGGSYHTFESMPDRAGARVGIIARF